MILFCRVLNLVGLNIGPISTRALLFKWKLSFDRNEMFIKLIDSLNLSCFFWWNKKPIKESRVEFLSMKFKSSRSRSVREHRSTVTHIVKSSSSFFSVVSDEDQTSTDHSQLETTKSFLELRFYRFFFSNDLLESRFSRWISSTNFESTIQTSIETTSSSTTSRPINNTTHSTSKTRITTQETTGKTSTEKASSSTTSRRIEDTTHSTSKTQITTQETTIHTEEINTQVSTASRFFLFLDLSSFDMI